MLFLLHFINSPAPTVVHSLLAYTSFSDECPVHCGVFWTLLPAAPFCASRRSISFSTRHDLHSRLKLWQNAKSKNLKLQLQETARYTGVSDYVFRVDLYTSDYGIVGTCCMHSQKLSPNSIKPPTSHPPATMATTSFNDSSKYHASGPFHLSGKSFLWLPVRWRGTRCQTTWDRSPSARTRSDNIWRRFCLLHTDAYRALDVFRLHWIHETHGTDVRDVCLSVCPSICLSRGSTRRRVQCVRGHSVQPLPNYFGLLFTITCYKFTLTLALKLHTRNKWWHIPLRAFSWVLTCNCWARCVSSSLCCSVCCRASLRSFSCFVNAATVRTC